jgi:MerR family redox-sensitive transcriptional activator SoxR
MNSHTATDDLVTVAEAAELLGLSNPGVKYMENIGELRAERTAGNQRRFHRAEVEALALRRARARADAAAAELAATEARIAASVAA